MIRVELPYHLRVLARIAKADVTLEVPPPVTQRRLLDALEVRFPALRGTVRDHQTQLRRPLIRFYACQRDLSLEPPDAPLPDAVANGAEAFMIVGSLAGG